MKIVEKTVFLCGICNRPYEYTVRKALMNHYRTKHQKEQAEMMFDHKIKHVLEEVAELREITTKQQGRVETLESKEKLSDKIMIATARVKEDAVQNVLHEHILRLEGFPFTNKNGAERCTEQIKNAFQKFMGGNPENFGIKDAKPHQKKEGIIVVTFEGKEFASDVLQSFESLPDNIKNGRKIHPHITTGTITREAILNELALLIDQKYGENTAKTNIFEGEAYLSFFDKQRGRTRHVNFISALVEFRNHNDINFLEQLKLDDAADLAMKHGLTKGDNLDQFILSLPLEKAKVKWDKLQEERKKMKKTEGKRKRR